MRSVLLQILPSLLLFGMLCLGRAVWLGDRPPRKAPATSRFDVYEREGKWMAVPSSASFQWADAIAYVVFSYIALPYWIVRYGWRRGVLLPLVPFIGIPVAMLLVRAMEHKQSEAGILLGIVLVALIRASIGLALGSRAVDWRREVKLIRGWRAVGSCTASGQRDAIRVFDPPQQKHLSATFLGRCRAYFERQRSSGRAV